MQFDYETDEENYLLDFKQWDENFAQKVMSDLNIEYSLEHSKIIELVREFFNNFNRSPETKPLMNWLKHHQKLLNIEVNSVNMIQLFGNQFTGNISKASGLTKPKGCW